MVIKTRRVKPPEPAPERPMEWSRADPAALARFDPASKTCTMNCGKHAHDPRCYTELKFMCDDCDCHEPKGTPAMLEPTCTASQLIAALHAMIEQRGDLPVYARDPDTDMRLPLGLLFAQADDAEGWPERLELTTDYNRPPPGALAKGTDFTPGVKTDI